MQSRWFCLTFPVTLSYSCWVDVARNTGACEKTKSGNRYFYSHLGGDDDGDGGLIVRSGETCMDLGLGGVYSK